MKHFTLTAEQITTLLTLRDDAVRLASELPLRIRDTHANDEYSNIFEVAVEGRICGYINTAGTSGTTRTPTLISNAANIVETNDLIIDNGQAFKAYLVAAAECLDTNTTMTAHGLNAQKAFTEEARMRAEKRSEDIFGIL
jgi:hypothetical protein